MTIVRVNVPEPVKKTYDILGLTEEEMTIIVNLVGATTGPSSAFNLYQQLPSELFSDMYSAIWPRE